jgi:hypothetical protein
MDSTIAFLKIIFGVITYFFASIVYSIEPSVGVWIVSISGSLLTISFGKDYSVGVVIVHILIGLGWGIFGSQLVHAEYISLPQLPTSFFAAMFGVELTWFFIRNLQITSFSSIIESTIDTIMSKFGKKKD